MTTIDKQKFFAIISGVMTYIGDFENAKQVSHHLDNTGADCSAFFDEEEANQVLSLLSATLNDRDFSDHLVQVYTLGGNSLIEYQGMHVDTEVASESLDEAGLDDWSYIIDEHQAAEYESLLAIHLTGSGVAPIVDNQTLATLKKMQSLVEHATLLFRSLSYNTSNEVDSLFEDGVGLWKVERVLEEAIAEEPVMRAHLGAIEMDRQKRSGESKAVMVVLESLLGSNDDKAIKSNFISQGLYLDTIAEHAIEQNDAQLMGMLLDYYPSTFGPSYADFSALPDDDQWASLAASHGAADVLTAIINTSPNVDLDTAASRVLSDRNTAMFLADSDSDIATLDALLNAGVDLDSMSSEIIEKLEEQGLDEQIAIFEGYLSNHAINRAK